MLVENQTLARMAQKLRRHSIESTTAGRLGPSDELHVGGRDHVGPLLRRDALRPARPERPRRRRVRALQGPRRADPVGRAQGGGRHRRRPADPAPSHDSRLEGHPTPLVPWVRVATGSLGQGLSRRRRAWPGRASSTASRAASTRSWATARWRRARCGRPRSSPSFNRPRQPLRDRRRQPPRPERPHDVRAPRRGLRARAAAPSAGRRRSVDGHDVARAARGASRARATVDGKPFAHRGAHPQGQGRLLPRGQGRLARQAGQEGRGAGARPWPSSGDTERHARRSSRGATTAEPRRAARPELAGRRPPTRRARRSRRARPTARALAKLAKSAPQVVALDGDTKNSTFSDQLQGRGARALRGGLHRRAEHGGRRARHVHRGQDPVRLHLRLLPDARLRLHPHGRVLAAASTSCCAAATPGVSIGEDGPSQMALEDLAMMRALVDSRPSSTRATR